MPTDVACAGEERHRYLRISSNSCAGVSVMGSWGRAGPVERPIIASFTAAQATHRNGCARPSIVARGSGGRPMPLAGLRVPARVAPLTPTPIPPTPPPPPARRAPAPPPPPPPPPPAPRPLP